MPLASKAKLIRDMFKVRNYGPEYFAEHTNRNNPLGHLSLVDGLFYSSGIRSFVTATDNYAEQIKRVQRNYCDPSWPGKWLELSHSP